MNSNQKQILQVLSLDKPNGEKYSNFSTTFVQFQCRYLLLGVTKATNTSLLLFKSVSKAVLSKQAPFSAEIISNSANTRSSHVEIKALLNIFLNPYENALGHLTHWQRKWS